MLNRRTKLCTLMGVSIILLSGCGTINPLAPPELSREPCFRLHELCLDWVNLHADAEGFQGYNVYISTQALAELAGDDSLLADNLVRARIGRNQDTIAIRCERATDGTWLDELDSFYVHVRSVANDTVGEGGKEYVVYPENCQVIQPVRNLEYEVIADEQGNPGGGLHLTWDVPASELTPDGYLIFTQEGYDHNLEDTVTQTEYNLYTPTATVDVYALYGEDLSRSVDLWVGAIHWEDVELYSTDEPDSILPNGFGFNPAAIDIELIPVSDTDNWQEIDFFITDLADLASPQIHQPPLNDKGGGISLHLVYGGFLGRDSVPAANDANYDSSRDLMFSQSYALWVDYTSNGYSADDRFGKIGVDAIDGYRVILDIAYQPVPGLRWVSLGW